MKFEIGKQIKATTKSCDRINDVTYIVRVDSIDEQGIHGTYEVDVRGKHFDSGTGQGVFSWQFHDFEHYTPPAPTFAQRLGAIAAFLHYGKRGGHKDFSPGGAHYEALKFHLRLVDIDKAYKQLTGGPQ